MSIQSCYFCVLDVEKLWFWMCIRQVSILCHFSQFILSCVLRVFNSAVATSAQRLLGLSRVFDYDLYWRRESELACCLYLYHQPRSHFTTLLTWVLFIGPCHCSYIFVPCLAFCAHIAGDGNKTASSVVGVLSTYLALDSGWSVRAWAALCN